MLITIIGFQISQMVNASSDYEFSKVEINEQYVIGEELVLPKATLSNGTKSFETITVVHMPNGNAYQTKRIALEQFGKYVIEYRQVIDKKLYSMTESFYVVEPLYRFLNDKSTGVYDKDRSEYNTGHYGINVSLERGDVFTYNDIIDLRQLDADTPAVELFVTPLNGIGTKDVKKLIFTFTDIYDETNSVRVIGNGVDDDGDPGQWWASSVYLQAGAFDTTSGVEWVRNIVHTNNAWGYPATFSLYGTQAKRPVIGKEFLSISFDLEEKQVFGPLGRKGNFIIDLDDSNYVSKPWDGFTTGEVYLSITAEEYTAPSFNFVITKIGQNDISPLYNYDQKGPSIEIDFEGLDQLNLPNAKKGYTYPVFKATAFDAVTKESQVTKRVFYNYYTAQRFELPITENRFLVPRDGIYTIEYTSKDWFGNQTVRLVHINTTQANSDLLLDVDSSQLPSEGSVGKRIDLPSISYEGGFGQLNMTIYAKIDGEKILIQEDYFRPEKRGIYELVFELTDTIGQIEAISHQIAIMDNNLPVFIEDAVMPKYVIAGSSYELDDLKGFDYNTNQYANTSIFVSDGSGSEIPVTNGSHRFTPNQEGKATIIYRAINDHGHTDITYVVDVIKVKDPFIDMTAYFVGNNLKANATSQYVSLGNSVVTKSASFEFIHYLNANQLSMRFRINPFQNNFSRLDFYLEDYANPNQMVKLSFIKPLSSGAIQVEINNQPYAFNLTTTFSNGGEINVVYDNQMKRISINNSLPKTILTYLDGQKFMGFSTNRIYLSGVFGMVTGASEIQLSNINGQLFSTDQDDFVKPAVSLSGIYQSTYRFNQTATVYKANAIDVLDPEVTGHVTVKDQSGNVVRSTDNVLLNEVPFDRDYQIKLSTYGSYLVTYTARDTNGSGNASYTYALFVMDNVKPTINVSKPNPTTAKINQAFKIEPATAIDEVDGTLKVVYFIILPTGQIVYIKDSSLSYTPTIKGIHQIRYFTVDSSGNQTYLDFNVDVK